MEIKPEIMAISYTIDYSPMWSLRANFKITYISLKSQLAGGRPLEEEKQEKIKKKEEEGEEAKKKQ